VDCTVIICSYNNFAALEKALWGYEVQTYRDFEIIIADDGSDASFADGLRAYQHRSRLRIHHVWHPHNGYRQNAIFNKAITHATSEYLIFTDADVVPRADFVSAHCRLARPRRFLSGGSHLDLPIRLHQTLSMEDVQSQRIFSLPWLAQQGVQGAKFFWRLRPTGAVAYMLDVLAPRFNAFLGSCASAFRKDILAINGFDETYAYGGGDRDLGIRLANSGVYGIRYRHSLCYLHLAHGRPYRDEEVIRANRRLIAARRWAHVTSVEHGLANMKAVEESPVSVQ
jgi:GT2 family glycosyltransferase